MENRKIDIIEQAFDKGHEIQFNNLIKLLVLENFYQLCTNPEIKKQGIRNRQSIRTKDDSVMYTLDDAPIVKFFSENGNEIDSFIEGEKSFESDSLFQINANNAGLTIEHNRARGSIRLTSLLSNDLKKQLTIKQIIVLDAILFESETKGGAEFVSMKMTNFSGNLYDYNSFIENDQKILTSVFNLPKIAHWALSDLIPVEITSLSDIFSDNDCNLTPQFARILKNKIDTLRNSLLKSKILEKTQKKDPQAIQLEKNFYKVTLGAENNFSYAIKEINEIAKKGKKLRFNISPSREDNEITIPVSKATNAIPSPTKPSLLNRFGAFLKRHRTKIIVSAVVIGLIAIGIFTCGVLSTAGVIVGTGTFAVGAAKVGGFSILIAKIFGLGGAAVMTKAAVGTTIAVASSTILGGSTAIMESALQETLQQKSPEPAVSNKKVYEESKSHANVDTLFSKQSTFSSANPKLSNQSTNTSSQKKSF